MITKVMKILESKLVVRFVALSIVFSLGLASSGFAQTTAPKYAVELVVTRGEKSVETDADIMFGETGITIVPDKRSFSDQRREFAYSQVKTVDYSYAKKPMISVGGAVAVALLISVFAPIPFLFLKKKRYWMTVNTENGYAVLRLGDRNHRQIAAELRSRGVTVSDLIKEGK
jgi:hypothetical protein